MDHGDPERKQITRLMGKQAKVAIIFVFAGLAIFGFWMLSTWPYSYPLHINDPKTEIIRNFLTALNMLMIVSGLFGFMVLLFTLSKEK